jgi:hypothetical protein
LQQAAHPITSLALLLLLLVVVVLLLLLLLLQLLKVMLVLQGQQGLMVVLPTGHSSWCP